MSETRKEKIEQLDNEIAVKRAEYEDLRKEYEALEDALGKTRKKLEKLYKKQASGKELTNAELRNKAIYEKNIKELEAKIAGISTTSTTNTNTANTSANKNTPPSNTNAGNKNTPQSNGTVTGNKNTPPSNGNGGNGNKNTPPSSTETALKNSEQKAQETADAINSEEDNNTKVDDAGSATETAKEMANTVDANIEENVPTWFWREAREMAPTDKAKRGFLISDYITNRLGTALGNTGAVVQNNGGSGGGQIKAQGGSYIDQYRQGKMEQALANRKKKQDSLMQAQNDILTSILDSENEVRAIQNKLRNSGYYNNFNRLTNEQQVYIKGLLYSDTQGKISNAVLGNLINKLLAGEDISLNELTSTVLVASGIDDAKQITNGASNILKKAMNAAGKVGEWGEGWLKNYKKAGE